MGLGDKLFDDHSRANSAGTSNVPRPPVPARPAGGRQAGPLQAAPQPVRTAPKQTPGQRKKPAPPAQTDAESFYYVKQMKLRTPVTVVLNDGEVLHGVVDWYDRWCIKLARTGGANYLIYKQSIKYLYKDGDEPPQGDT